MTGELVKYTAACNALAACVRVDEAKKIRDQAEAMRVYAQQASNREMEITAAEIRLRAEYRLGELIRAQKQTVGLHKGGRPKTRSGAEQVSKPKLAEVGIDRKLSMRAQRLAELPLPKFAARLHAWRQQASASAERVSVDLMREGDKAAQRAKRERILGGLQLAMPSKRFGVILADPEWRFQPRSRKTGMSRAADNHYPTSETDAICARKVPAADDAVLWLWATSPMLPDALRVMAAWGFTYKSHLVWRKTRNGKGRGSGYWFTGEHELLLVGTRGRLPAPATALCGSVIDAPAGRHSAKPECFAELIERAFPTLPKIELNRRGPPRKGWSAWGNEAETEPRSDKSPEALRARKGTSARDGRTDRSARPSQRSSGARAARLHSLRAKRVKIPTRRRNHQKVTHGRKKKR